MSIKNNDQVTEGGLQGPLVSALPGEEDSVWLCGIFSLSCTRAQFRAQHGLGFLRVCSSVSSLSLEPWLQQVHNGLVSALHEALINNREWRSDLLSRGKQTLQGTDLWQLGQDDCQYARSPRRWPQ